ncbi:MAG: TIGR00268 family protein, partial [Thermoplasmata archaeon]|nr:TIGR00268 family protein [Thermoplasmata archaeon]
MEQKPEEKYSMLIEILCRYPRAIVAFSGGTDSLLLLRASVDALSKEKVEAVIGLSPTLPEQDLRDAEEHAKALGVRLHRIETGIMDVQNFTSNPSDRCRHCRVKLAEVIAGLGRDGPIFDGANIDDLSDYRPGLKVSTKLGVGHPLIEAGITKRDV